MPARSDEMQWDESSWLPLIVLVIALVGLGGAAKCLYNFPAKYLAQESSTKCAAFKSEQAAIGMINVQDFFHGMRGQCPSYKLLTCKPALRCDKATRELKDHGRALKIHASRHVWAATGLFQCGAMITTIGVALASLYYWKLADSNASRSCGKQLQALISWKQGLVILTVLVFLGAGLWWQQPFANPSDMHGRLFNAAFARSGATSLSYVVILGNVLAAIMALAVVVATFTALRVGERTASLYFAIRPLNNEFTQQGQRVYLLATMTSITLSLSILQINALARLPLSLIECEDCATLVKNHADAATLAASAAFTFVLIAFFGSAFYVIWRRHQQVVQQAAAGGIQLKLKDAPFALQKLQLLGQLLLPLLAGLVASYLGVGLK